MASESLDESWLNPLEEVSELPEFLMPCLTHNLIVLLIFPNPIVDQFLASSKLWLLKLYPQNHHSLIPNTMSFVCQLVSHVEPANFQSVTANSQLWVLSTTQTNTSQIHIPNLIPTLPILGVLKAIRNHWDLPHWMALKNWSPESSTGHEPGEVLHKWLWNCKRRCRCPSSLPCRRRRQEARREPNERFQLVFHQQRAYLG